MEAVLIIEDDEDLAAGIQCLLRNYGMIPYMANNGKEGINTIHALMPDLILCDIQMPGADGYEVLKKLKHDPKIAHIPLIFITGLSRPEDLRKGMVLGAENYLVKPVTDVDLYAAIAACRAKQRHKKEKEELFCKQLAIHISNILSHELRTPLTGITALVDLLEDFVSKPDPEQGRLLIELYRGSAVRLGQAVERFLYFAELNASIYNGDKSYVIRSKDNIAPLIYACASRLAREYSRLGDLRISGSAYIEMEERCLSRCIVELVDNAFKFSSPGTLVEVEIVAYEDKLMLTVMDSGRGMSDNEIVAIRTLMQFDRFKYEQQGFGLGISIIRFISEYYGGKIFIKSQQNIGTTIGVELPIYSRAENAGGE